ncbi:hypothetical protein [Sinorhizobium medicae]|uniref:hypothetical protein n=1 Tax=Sinorhizobium medicae TaxID=110321 RepID=UPI0013E34883|nr:hypothetical protein [Sinorhizobium medicae]
MNSNAQTLDLFIRRERRGLFVAGTLEPPIARLRFQYRNRIGLDPATEIFVFHQQILTAWDLFAELVHHQSRDLIDSAKALKCQPVGAGDFVAITGQGEP